MTLINEKEALKAMIEQFENLQKLLDLPQLQLIKDSEVIKIERIIIFHYFY